jgi:nitrate/nitrite transporter NarK
LNIADLKKSGHWPTLLTAFLYFDFSFMVWTVLGPLGAGIGEALLYEALTRRFPFGEIGRFQTSAAQNIRVGAADARTAQFA